MRQRTIRRTGAFVALAGLLLALGAAAAGSARAGDEVCVTAGLAVASDRLPLCPGTLRIEKRAGSAEGDLLPGATFEVDCTPAEEVPAIVVTGLDEGVATTGVVTITGPAGSECTVTEVAAPEGYDLPGEPARTLTIPPAGDTTVEIFVDTVTVEPTEEPTTEPTGTPDPVVEPGDPDPTIAPTVLGVKIVRPPPQLPQTGPSTGLLAASLLGVVLVLAGSGLVAHARVAARRH
jgi:LPXTG-motif cell wall-anchored protein